jgi:hypothetical protein
MYALYPDSNTNLEAMPIYIASNKCFGKECAAGKEHSGRAGVVTIIGVIRKLSRIAAGYFSGISRRERMMRVKTILLRFGSQGRLPTYFSNLVEVPDPTSTAPCPSALH